MRRHRRPITRTPDSSDGLHRWANQSSLILVDPASSPLCKWNTCSSSEGGPGVTQTDFKPLRGGDMNPSLTALYPVRREQGSRSNNYDIRRGKRRLECLVPEPRARLLPPYQLLHIGVQSNGSRDATID
jgi:hypothetical protein